ncbi:MAG TPA: hypothetical protein DCS29_02755 [Candidatus Magasanikbacteria bacterium]|nr:MAG: hypothetical protein A2479_00265 [Candidatus Magasanikbacteria bacterium RIFOXYC2_FULL_39_8]HAT03672.1 hypothetical protein [Candidatus Magasanikbacteria bacterium]
MYRRYTRKRNRLFGFDYRNRRYYFITICTEDKMSFFGGVYNGIMCVNRLGSVIYRQWEWLEQQYNYIRLYGFVVMPNHVHGILEIVGPESVGTGRDRGIQTNVDNEMNRVGTGLDLSLHAPGSCKILSLSHIIGAFKTTSSKRIHEIGFSPFKWQRSFYDNIIRDKIAFHNIQRYIINNPPMWHRDRNNRLDFYTTN